MIWQDHDVILLATFVMFQHACTTCNIHMISTGAHLFLPNSSKVVLCIAVQTSVYLYVALLLLSGLLSRFLSN